jgi:hypothetical protein
VTNNTIAQGPVVAFGEYPDSIEEGIKDSGETYRFSCTVIVKQKDPDDGFKFDRLLVSYPSDVDLKRWNLVTKDGHLWFMDPKYSDIDEYKQELQVTAAHTLEGIYWQTMGGRKWPMRLQLNIKKNGEAPIPSEWQRIAAIEARRWATKGYS